MDAPRRVFKLTYVEGDWFWRLDIMNDDGLIGPFLTRDDAEKDARETLGIREPRRHLIAIEPAPRPVQSSPPRAERYTLAARAIRFVSIRDLRPYHRGRPAVRHPARDIRHLMGRSALRRP
jgi:hypothetical protein